MNNGCHLADAVRLGYIDGVGVAIPYQLNRRKGMIPAEIHAANARPMFREVAVLNRERLFRHREYLLGGAAVGGVAAGGPRAAHGNAR